MLTFFANCFGMGDEAESLCPEGVFGRGEWRKMGGMDGAPFSRLTSALADGHTPPLCPEWLTSFGANGSRVLWISSFFVCVLLFF
jgi:hypothetical protein